LLCAESVLIRLILKKTPYELFKGRKPNVSHLKVFACKCFILNNDKDNLGKFDSKADEGIFLGYSFHGHAYRAYNKRIMLVEESIHIAFDETNQNMEENSKTGAMMNFQTFNKLILVWKIRQKKSVNHKKFNQLNQKISLLKLQLIRCN